MTQAYGDLRDYDTCVGYAPRGEHRAQFNISMEVMDQWSEEEVCVPIDEEGNEECHLEWFSAHGGTTAAERTRSMALQWDTGASLELCADDFPLVPENDVGTIPPTLTLQVDVATNQWVLVNGTQFAEAECNGPLACNLDVVTVAPTQLSITSSNGTLVAWHGIAGLTRVPEPDAVAAAGAALLALVTLARRGRA